MRSKRYFYFSQLALGATLGGCIGSALAGGRWYDYALIPALVTLALLGLALCHRYRENGVRATLRRLEAERRGLEAEREREEEECGELGMQGECPPRWLIKTSIVRAMKFKEEVCVRRDISYGQVRGSAQRWVSR